MMVKLRPPLHAIAPIRENLAGAIEKATAETSVAFEPLETVLVVNLAQTSVQIRVPTGEDARANKTLSNLVYGATTRTAEEHTVQGLLSELKHPNYSGAVLNLPAAKTLIPHESWQKIAGLQGKAKQTIKRLKSSLLLKRGKRQLQRELVAGAHSKLHGLKQQVGLCVQALAEQSQEFQSAFEVQRGAKPNLGLEVGFNQALNDYLAEHYPRLHTPLERTQLAEDR